MVAVTAGPSFRGVDLKVSDQNNWVGGPEQKIKFRGELNVREAYEHQ